MQQEARKETSQKEVEEEKDNFECSVCYGNDDEKGIVIPKRCTHKICLDCYSTILIKHKTRAKCPLCRTEYLDQEDYKDDEEFAENANQLENNDNYIIQSSMDYLLNINISPYTSTYTAYDIPIENDIISFFVMQPTPINNNNSLGNLLNNVVLY